MIPQQEIIERDAILRAADTLTEHFLGDQWSFNSHMIIKTWLLNLIDGEIGQ